MATVGESQSVAGARTTVDRGDWTMRAFMALVALVVGIGIGWVLSRDSGVPSDVQELVEGYEEAWLDGDGEGAVGYMTDGARFVSPGYVAAGGISGDALATHISTSPVAGLEFRGIESVVGDNPYVVVTTGSYADRDGFGVLYIVEEGGELRIAHSNWHD